VSVGCGEWVRVGWRAWVRDRPQPRGGTTSQWGWSGGIDTSLVAEGN